MLAEPWGSVEPQLKNTDIQKHPRNDEQNDQSLNLLQCSLRSLGRDNNKQLKTSVILVLPPASGLFTSKLQVGKDSSQVFMLLPLFLKKNCWHQATQ